MAAYASDSLLYGGLALLGVTVSLCYGLLVVFSPDIAHPRPSEKTYRSPPDPTAHKPLASIQDPGTIDLSVIIPAYNETARLPEMFASTLEHLLSSTSSPKPKRKAANGKASGSAKTTQRTFEIVVVDDGSRDGTADLALKLGADYPAAAADVRVVVLEKNLGKGGAVRHGMLHARGRRLLMVDADGASRFEDLEKLWAAMDELTGGVAGDERAAVAVGSRAHLVKTEAVVKRSMLRNVLMYGLHTILRIVGVGHIRDTQCGFKLFTRAAARGIFPYQHLPTWIFDVELLLLAKEVGMPVAEVPIEWHEVGGSKLHVVADSLQMLRDLLVLRANLLLGRWKVPRETSKTR